METLRVVKINRSVQFREINSDQGQAHLLIEGMSEQFGGDEADSSHQLTAPLNRCVCSYIGHN